MNSNILSLPWLDQSPGQARHPGPGSLAILGGLDASNKVFCIVEKLIVFLSWKKFDCQSTTRNYRLPEHIVLRTPSSSDQVSLS